MMNTLTEALFNKLDKHIEKEPEEMTHTEITHIHNDFVNLYSVSARIEQTIGGSELGAYDPQVENP